jgi:hypothetical protein
LVLFVKYGGVGILTPLDTEARSKEEGFWLLDSGFMLLTAWIILSSAETTTLWCAPEGGFAAGRGGVRHAAHFLLGRHEGGEG